MGPRLSFLLAACLLLAAAPAPAPASARSLESTIRKELRRGATSASGVLVRDLTARRTLVSIRARTPRRLGSITKLFTAAALLDRGTAPATLTTQTAASSRAPVIGNLTLIGGGDPVFGSAAFNAATTPGLGANIETLADGLVADGLREVSGRVIATEGRFDSLRGGPATGGAFDPEIGGSLSAVAFNRGRADDTGPLQAEPAPAAALALRRALTARGVVVRDQDVADPAVFVPLRSLQTPVPPLVKPMLKESDDWIAEMLAKGLDPMPPATTARGVATIASFASNLRPSAQARLVDGSGTSRGNEAAPAEVVDLLQAMRNTGAFREALPIAGRDGTLEDRMRSGPARGRCSAKTGTLRGTTNLAGYCRRRDGHLVAFAFLLRPRGGEAAGERALDRMAAAVAR